MKPIKIRNVPCVCGTLFYDEISLNNHIQNSRKTICKVINKDVPKVDLDVCDYCNKHIIYEGSMCDDCDIKYCDGCDDENILMLSSDHDTQRKCPNCADTDYIYAVEESNRKEEELLVFVERLESTKITRKKEISDKLRESGLTLRRDSKLCQVYIDNDIGDVDDIVNRMAEMKYLYEYCNMKNELKKVEQEHIETLENGHYPDSSVFEEAEYNIIERVGGYPDQFPWLI